MWYATEGGGLCRDNGYKIDVFRNDRNHPNLLGSNDITCIGEDAVGRIWFGTTKGCYILDKKDYSIRRLKETADKGISFLLRRSSGEMLVSVVGNLFVFSPELQLLRTYEVAKGRTDAWITSMAEDRQHDVWMVVVNDGLYRLSSQDGKLVNMNWPYAKTANYLATDSVRGGLWIGTWGLGVVRYTKDFKRMFETMGEEGADTFQSQVLNVVVDQHRSLLWVITMEDIYAYRIHAESLTPVDITAVLPQGKKIIDNAVLDHRGNLWVPGYSPHTFIISSSDGVIRRDEVQPMSDKTGYRVMVDRILHTGGDYYWIWQGRTNLSLYNAATKEMVFSNEPPTSQPFSTGKYMVPGTDGNYVWTAHGRDILRVRHDGMTIRSESFATTGKPVASLCDAGEQLWVGTTDGIEVFQKNNHKGTVLASELGTVRELRVSTDGIGFFVSAKLGFACIDAKGKVEVLQDDGDFTTLALSAEHTVWAATTGGSVFSANSSSSISSIKAQLSKGSTNSNGDAIKDLEVDKRGHLWILSDQYLKEYNPDNGASRVIRNTDPDVDMDYFHTIQVDGDSILLGGIGAFCAISPSERLETASSAVRPRVTSYLLDGTEYYCGTDEVHIPKGTREAVLCVSTFDPLNAAHIRIAYRLSSDEEWKELEQGRNRIYLRSLDPGGYTLEVRATDEYGRWSDSVECMTVRQLDDWWKQPWFRWSLLVIVILLVLFAVLRYRKTLTKISKMLMPRKLSLMLSPAQELNKLRQKQEKKDKADSEFLSQVRQKVREHLDDPQFGVKELSSSVYMSRMNLYRRLQATAGVNPTDFIRTVRLEAAAELLATTDLSVAEVSDRTGFGTARYFSRCFKDRYGVLPKDFRTQKPTQT